MGLKSLSKKYLFLVIAVLGLIRCQNINTFNNSTPNKIKVAVFNGNGASATCILETYEALKIDTGIISSEISAAEIELDRLSKFDAIIFPGGSASKELNNLGQTAAEKVKQFIKAGKGAVGICAGGYLFSTTKGYPSMQLVSATEWDREHYNKGRALVEFALTQKGKEIFPELDSVNNYLQYYDGPVLMPSDSGKSGITNYLELGTYVSDIHIKKNYPRNITPGKTFLLSESVEKGKVMVVAGHPEATPGMRWMVPRMARWVTNNPLIAYPEKWVKPTQYDSAIFFTNELAKKEKELFWQLLGPNDSIKLEAMQQLYKMHSRPAVRWNMGLLRDTSAEVRTRAAYYLRLTEYSAAIPDLESALKNESNDKCKIQLEETLLFLSNF